MLARRFLPVAATAATVAPQLDRSRSKPRHALPISEQRTPPDQNRKRVVQRTLFPSANILLRRAVLCSSMDFDYSSESELPSPLSKRVKTMSQEDVVLSMGSPPDNDGPVESPDAPFPATQLVPEDGEESLDVSSLPFPATQLVPEDEQESTDPPPLTTSSAGPGVLPRSTPSASLPPLSTSDSAASPPNLSTSSAAGGSASSGLQALEKKAVEDGDYAAAEKVGPFSSHGTGKGDRSRPPHPHSGGAIELLGS